jgi:hypothetical protein
MRMKRPQMLNSIIFLSLVLAGLVSPLPTPAWSQTPSDIFAEIPFTRRDILRAQELTQKIVELYPTDKYHYVFIGRSLTMIRALMDLQELPNTGLPFSGKSIDLNFDSPFGRELRPILLNHLDHYLPEPTSFSGKELVLLDFTNSGYGILMAQKTLNWYYQGRQKINLLRVSIQPLILRGVFNRLLGRPLDKTIVIDRDSMVAKHFENSNFDSFAGYGKFNVENGTYREFDDNSLNRFVALKRWILQMKPSVLSSGVDENDLKLNCIHYLHSF